MDQQSSEFRFAGMMAGAGIFLTWRLIRSIRDSAWENVWWRNVSPGCARWEFSERSFWWRTIIRADAIFGSAAVGKNCRAQWRWAKTCRPESQVKGQKSEVRVGRMMRFSAIAALRGSRPIGFRFAI